MLRAAQAARVQAEQARLAAEAKAQASLQLYQLILLALKVLSERTVDLAGHVLPLIGLGVMGWLTSLVIDGPTTHQIVALGVNGLFFLFMLFILRRR